MLSFFPAPTLLAHDALLAHALYHHPTSCALSFDEPQVDTSGDAIDITLRAPGVAAKDLAISFEDSTLHVKGETASASATHTHFIERVFNFGGHSVDADKATATCSDGIITIAIPKKDAEPERRTLIAVTPAETDPDESNSEGDASRYTLTAPVAGFAPTDLTVACHGRVLKVEGESKRLRSKIHKLFRLPRDSDTSSITASCVDGILFVAVPKKVVTKTTIAVNATGAAGGSCPCTDAPAASCGCTTSASTPAEDMVMV